MKDINEFTMIIFVCRCVFVYLSHNTPLEVFLFIENNREVPKVLEDKQKALFLKELLGSLCDFLLFALNLQKRWKYYTLPLFDV